MRICRAFLLTCGISLGQWIHLPTPGIPRTGDGKANMEAPAPRLADGKPDLSGMWWISGPELPCPELMGGNKDCAEKGLGLAGQAGANLAGQATSIGFGMDGGLPYSPWAEEQVRLRSAASGDDPHVRCLPSSPPRWYTLPHLQKILQTPGLLVMLNEYNASYRQIFLDGRPLPADPLPSWNGYSTAHWDGDVLVVETLGFRDDLWLDMRGSPLTNAGKVTERIRRPNFGTITIDFTVDDPKAYTKPWTAKLSLFRVVDTELIDEMCMENEKSSAHMKKQE